MAPKEREPRGCGCPGREVRTGGATQDPDAWPVLAVTKAGRFPRTYRGPIIVTEWSGRVDIRGSTSPPDALFPPRSHFPPLRPTLPNIPSASRGLARRALRRSGVLGELRRARIQHRLTVIGRLRLLPYHDPRRVGAMANFTLPASMAGPLPDVLNAHHNMISAQDVRRVRRAPRIVPPHLVGQRLECAADLLAGGRSACEILHVSRIVLVTHYAEEYLARLFEWAGSDDVIMDERRAPAHLRDGKRIPPGALHRPPLDQASVADALFASHRLVSW